MLSCPQCLTTCHAAHRFCHACGVVLTRPAPASDPVLGCTLHGGYVVRDKIGDGTTGSVYRAHQPALAREVAVKIIHPHLAGDEAASSRFLVEARAASRINHPNAVTIYAFGSTAAGQPYIVMQLLAGKELRRLASEEGPLGEERVVDILDQVLAALGQAHGASIVHGDVKPENVIVERRRSGADFVKVFDFGLARVAAEADDAPATLAAASPYASPERARGERIDARSDLYSVGVMLHELLTGALPGPGAPAPPGPFAAIVARATAERAEDRFQTADDFAVALGRAIGRAPRRASSAPPAAIRACHACGVASAPGRSFCGACGAPLVVGAAPRSLAPMSSRAPGAEPSQRDLAFVGRDEDLAWLHARRVDARLAPTRVRLVGEDGAGKTRLLRAFVEQARAAGAAAVVIEGEAYESQLGAEPLAADRLRADIRAARARLPSGEVVLVIDDADRMDPTSRRAVASVFARPPDVPHLFVLTHAPQWTTAQSWSSSGVREVGALPAEAVATLLGPDGWPTESAAPALPLHVDQLRRFRRGRAAPAPSELAQLVVARLERRSEIERRVLAALAVWGDEADLATAARLAGVEDPLDAIVESLERDGFARVEQGRVRIAHRVLRRIVLAVTPQAARQELHGAAVRVLGPSAPLERRAFHASQSDRPFEALVLLERVAVRREARGDWQGAVDVLRDALALAREGALRDELADAPAAVTLFTRKLADALVRRERWEEASALLLEALATTARTSVESAHILRALARVAHGRGHHEDARRHVGEALVVAQEIGASELAESLTSFASILDAARSSAAAIDDADGG